MVRFLKAGIVTTLFVFLFVAGLFPSPAQVLAAPAAVVTVSSAEGNAGETVGITVSIQGFSSLAGVENISGGQFELVYDPDVASVNSVKSGSLLDDEVVFMPNLNYSRNSIMVAWAHPTGGIKSDGDLCNIIFTLKVAGSVNPTLKDLVLYDQDVNALLVKSEALPEGNFEGSSQVQLLSPGRVDTHQNKPDNGVDIRDDSPNRADGQLPENMSDPLEGNSSPGWLLPLIILAGAAIVSGAGYYIYLYIRASKSKG